MIQKVYNAINKSKKMGASSSGRHINDYEDPMEEARDNYLNPYSNFYYTHNNFHSGYENSQQHRQFQNQKQYPLFGIKDYSYEQNYKNRQGNKKSLKNLQQDRINQYQISNHSPRENSQNHQEENGNLYNILKDFLSKMPDDNPKVKPKKKTFEEKVAYFQKEIKKMKKHWENGFEEIIVDRDKILRESMKKFKKIDPYKELKIGFKGEVNNDAGGLIREWLTVLFSTLLDPKEKLFILGETNDISYLCKDNLHVNEKDYEKYIFIGQILSKALLENLTVNCCFNKLIYKTILEEEIEFEDLIFIDKSLYQSFKSMKEMDNIEDLEIYFVVEVKDKNNKIEEHKLIPNGNLIKVTKNNLETYIKKRVEFLVSSQDFAIGGIKEGMFSIIPQKLFKIFSSDELNLLINGTPFIDLEDWRINTKYQTYKGYEKVIIDFWKTMETLSQDDLGKFLQFATGSKRVPIGGFASLESNRGNKSSFTITKVEYSSKGSNYIRAHTCFNRIDLPNFPNEKLLKKAMEFVMKNEALGFGID